MLKIEREVRYYTVGRAWYGVWLPKEKGKEVAERGVYIREGDLDVLGEEEGREGAPGAWVVCG
jgi:hypothetical protein